MESLPQEYSARDESVRPNRPSNCDDMLPGMAVGEAANDMRMSQLARTIEQEIIPRLMLAHRAAPESPVQRAASGQPITRRDVEHFAKLVLSQDEDLAFASIMSFRTRGVPIETLYLELLAPTARYLGDLWNEDLCNFTDVTVGLGRLQRVLRELSPAFGCSVEHPSQGRRVLLLPSPGEQHTFGLVMVAEFFRRAGWDVTGGAWAAGVDASMMVGSEWFDAIGFSLGAEVHLQSLANAIHSIRHATCNRSIAVIVGGPIFGEHPEYVQLVGADGMTIDGREAPSMTERLIAREANRNAGRCFSGPP